MKVTLCKKVVIGMKFEGMYEDDAMFEGYVECEGG